MRNREVHNCGLGLPRLKKRFDRVQEFFGLERFGEEKFVRLEIDLAAHLVRIVTGGKDGFKTRFCFPQGSNQFTTITVFEKHISDHE